MANALFLRAAALMEERRYEEAAPLLLELHAAYPQEARINYLLAVIFNHYKDLTRAQQHLIAASKVESKRYEIFSLLSEVYSKIGRKENALEAARKAVALNSISEHAQAVLGDAYYNMQKPVPARQAFEKALELNPDFTTALVGLARLETSLGEGEKALEHLKRAYEIDPENNYVLVNLADQSDPELQGEVLDHILKQVDNPDSKNSLEANALLHFAAGKLFEKKDDIETAFTHYAKYKEAMYAPYNIGKRKWQLETTKGLFSKEFFEYRTDFGLSSERPVFVVGMPRSGTTLVEQIIGRHPKAAGVGELNFFSSLLTEMSGAEIVTPRLFAQAVEMDAKHAKRIGRKYLAELDKYDKKASRVVDKMPHNFEMLWMIALLFPNAKVIHTYREPADTCTSIYTTPLTPQHNYCRDLETLGQYYGMYVEMMEHWDKVLPIKIHHQSYEALIADQEAESRALLEYVGLPWDPVCLDFQSGERQVITFSSQQVRQPIYTSSMGRWRKYGSHIQPLLEALGKHAPQQ
ncbi:tetratricopeptide repeat-containing sulfotransferase family protein [Roseibium sp.]|uniref:tetratricopeptide repeat-containing sulfotransferase family protein n=1 Tax=Roseibium sp. TaxID=1936156 RepID=UPI003A9704F5